jgi:chaperonin GroES
LKMPVKPGDHVVFPGSAGVWVEVEEERLLVCRVGQLLGVLEEVDSVRPGPLHAVEEDDS